MQVTISTTHAEDEEKNISSSNENEVKAKENTEETISQEHQKEEPTQVDWYDKYIRLYADFENFRKRTNQERVSFMTSANEEILRDVLPILDDFERSIQAFEQKNTNVSTMKSGIQLIYDKLKHILLQHNLTPMQIQSGDEFNAELHEAITQTPTSDAKLKGKIIDVINTGYMRNDKVVRFAKVIIGQ